MKTRVALLASIFCLGLVAMAAAQVSTVEGTVVSNSGGALVISTDSGQRTFMVDAQSSLPADLAVGSRVRVEYHTLANDKFHAFKVSTLDAGATTGTTDTGTTSTTTTETTGNAMTGTTATAPATTAARVDTTTETTRTTTTTTGTMQDRPAADTTTTTDTTRTTDTTTATTDQTATTESGRTLPATASPLPLLALAGALSLAGGALLRRLA